MRRRRGISLGTIAMILIACITVVSTFGVIMTIRKDEGDLTIDAETLLGSVADLIAVSQRHINDGIENDARAIDAVIASTPNAEIAAPQTPAPTEILQSAVQITPPPAMPQTRHTLSMSFGGLIAFESSVLAGAYDKAGNTHNFEEMLSGISSAVHADLNIAVLDTMLSSDKSTTSDLLAPLQCSQAITAAGFDTMILCNENALAGGEKTVYETIDQLSKNGIITSGLYMPEASKAYDMLQINGISVALLSYTESLSANSKKAISDPLMQQAMIHLFDAEKAQADILAARAQGAQIVLVFINWGSENAEEITATQKKTAQLLCNAGVDILLGYNSMQVQPVTLLTSDANPAHHMLTAWSLGTLLSEDRATRAVVSGALLHVQLTYDTANLSVNFDKIEYTPTYCWRQEENGIYPYRVVRSDLSVPEGMIQKQREILARSLVLIQTTMKKGIAVQR